MANFPKPSDIESQYFRILKSIKPELNVNDPNSDFVIRGKAFCGVLSGLYGDQSKINNDTYIRSSRPEALDLHGYDLGISRTAATYAQSPTVEFTGNTDGVIIPVGLTLQYPVTGLQYTTTSQASISGGKARVSIQATQPGSIGNIQAPDQLTVLGPPAQVSNIATLIDSVSDGSDVETDDSYRSRLLSRLQQPPAGGNETDYITFAFNSDPSIRSASVKRHSRGLGTVDVYITSGTTDINSAVTNGNSIVRVPSSIILNKVQAYLNDNAPLTDCVGVFAPTEIAIDVSLNVVLAPGLSLGSILTDPTYNPQNLTVSDLIKREVARVLYNLPVGGRKISGTGQGYVVASDIENNLDEWLSANIDPFTRLTVGKIPVLTDRQVQPLNGAMLNRPIAENQMAAPGTITISLGVT